MSHYKPYPAYKDSGVEWLGQVPVHWDVKAIKWLRMVFKTLPQTHSEGLLPA